MAKITMKLHAIIIPKEDSGEPALFYNPKYDRWQEDFQLGCGFVSKKEAADKLEELNVEGAQIVQGNTKSL